MAYTGSVAAPQSQLDTSNSTSSTLTTGNTWNTSGSFVDSNGVAQVSVAVSSTYAVTLTIEQSQDSDGATIDVTRTIPVAASQECVRTFVPARRYYRVKVANASGSTATLRVDTRQHGTPVTAADLLPEPAPREHRLISTANVATEAGENWMSSQAIASRATTSDPIGLYKRASSGTTGFEAVAYWVDNSNVVVHDTATITLRPYSKVTVGATTYIAYAGDSQAKAPGTIMSFSDSAPGQTWLKVEAATAPGGATNLRILVTECNR